MTLLIGKSILVYFLMPGKHLRVWIPDAALIYCESARSCDGWSVTESSSARRQQLPLGNHDVVRLYGNLFQPSFKLREKTRIGARVIKRYHRPCRLAGWKHPSPKFERALTADVALSAASILQYLMSADPSLFTKKSLRTVQMAVKASRVEMIILNGDWMKCAPASPPTAAEETGHLTALNFSNILG